MSDPVRPAASGIERRFTVGLVVLLAVAILAVTWVGIRESRSDSLRLLAMQGAAFTEALAQAADNTIAAESFAEYLIHKRYHEIVRDIVSGTLKDPGDRDLTRLAMEHELYAAFLFDSSGTPTAGGAAAGPLVTPPEFVAREAVRLLSHPEENYVLMLDEGDRPGNAVHYYLEVCSDLSRVVLLVADALYYVDAARETQIGYLVQNMAREHGVEYIIYQSTEGIIFSSRKPGRLLAIESDPFLTAALDSDSVTSRRYVMNDREVLELVRPFSSPEYPYGLLRVGISLERYHAVSAGFDRLMIGSGIALFALLTVALLYISSRRKRRLLSREFAQMKTVTDRIFEQMRTGVATVDERGFVTLANSAFEDIFGYNNCIGNKWDEVVRAPELSQAALGSSHKTAVEREVEVSAADRRRTLLVAVSPLGAEGDHASGFVAVVYDITRLRGLEKDAARKVRLSEMGNLAAGVAHEIRNPLNTISIAVQRLAAEFAPTDNPNGYQAITGQIQAETKRLNDIITRFLSLAREEERKPASKADLSALIEEMIQFMRPEADSLGIEITAQIDPGLTVGAPPDAIKQVLTNLFTNAKEAMSGQTGAIAIAARDSQDHVSILFADSGPGIGRDIREEIFQPYFTTKAGGTGLGLTTVHKIVTDLGGDIRLQDDYTDGAAFVITLPR